MAIVDDLHRDSNGMQLDIVTDSVTGGQRLKGYMPMDEMSFWVRHAIDEIQDTYGDVVSVKPKSLLKFGRTTNADNGEKATIATFGSVATPNIVETFSTTNDIDAIVSSSGSDTGVLTIEGHTIDGSGLLTFVVQSVTLTGQTPAVLSVPIARASRVFPTLGTFASPSVDIVGDIYVYASSGVTVTNGVPQTNTAVKLRIVAGQNQSQKAATSISSVDYFLVSQIQASVSKGNSSTVSADIDLEVRRIGGVFRPSGLEISVRAGGSQAFIADFRPFLIIPKNSDIRLVAEANTNDSAVSGYFSGLLALVQS